MHVELFLDEGDEPWGLFARGHVDLAKFKSAAKRKARAHDLDREIGNLTPEHLYMRDAQKLGLTDDVDEDHPWLWCVQGEAGAIPVTAYKF